MEIMINEFIVILRIIGMMIRMMDVINIENIEDVVIVFEEEQEEYFNFIELNILGIIFEEFERNCIVFSFGDNQFIISYQIFIYWIEEVVRSYFMGESFGNMEIRVLYRILGRVLGVLIKKKEEFKFEDEIIYY